jgi:hypothetical protein
MLTKTLGKWYCYSIPAMANNGSLTIVLTLTVTPNTYASNVGQNTL